MVGDYNKDGREDLLLHDTVARTVRVFEIAGSSYFAPMWNFQVGNLACRSIAVRGKSVNAIAHLACFDREHAPELAAAENTDS